MRVDAGRTKRALAVLATLFAVLGAAGLVYPANSNAGEGLRQGAAFSQSYDMVGLALSGDLPGDDEIPAWFADELFYIEGAQSYASEDVGVYGFVSVEFAPDLKADVRSQMQERGWDLAGSADSAYLSFSRSGGQPSSVVVGFTEQDFGTTVVVQVMG